MEEPGISGSHSGSTSSDAANGGTGKSETARTPSTDIKARHMVSLNCCVCPKSHPIVPAEFPLHHQAGSQPHSPNADV